MADNPLFQNLVDYDGIQLTEYSYEECDTSRIVEVLGGRPELEVNDILHAVPSKFFSGYRWDLEDRDGFEREYRHTYYAWKASFPDDYVIPEPDEFDPVDWMKLENQGNIGSCQGHGLSSAAELAIHIDTGENLQLSRGFAYLASQEFDGLLGRDSGSTLGGGRKALTRGLPTEEAFPYRSYSAMVSDYRRRKDEILADTANLYRCEGYVPLRNEPDCKLFLASKSGAIEFGISWGLPNQAEITRYVGGRGGGHACFLTLAKHPSWGYAYRLNNSWGTSWGKNGTALCHPDVVVGMCNGRYNELQGISKAVSPRPKRKANL